MSTIVVFVLAFILYYSILKRGNSVFDSIQNKAKHNGLNSKFDGAG